MAGFLEGKIVAVTGGEEGQPCGIRLSAQEGYN